MKQRHKLTFLIIAFLFTVNFAKAQNWAQGIDDDNFNWGYSFQYISAEYKIWKKADWRTPFTDNTFMQVTDSLSSISSSPTSGFAIGFVANRKITNNIDLRLTPSLVFSDRKLFYTYSPFAYTVLDKTKKIQATMIELPLSIKLKSDRLMNFRAYMLGGLKYSIDMASAKKQNNANVTDEMEKFVNNKKSFLSYEAGIGCDFYFEYFKMSPEIKMSYSFKDIITHENTAFANPIDKAKLRHFTFSLFFE
jgi:hypothetical protein